MKRILFAGTTGLRKDRVLETLRHEIDRHSPEYRNRITIHSLEGCIKKANGGDASSFPLVKSLYAMRETWRQGLEYLRDEIRDHNPTGCALISSHLVFYRHGRPVAPVIPTLLGDLQLEAVVTLIDDIFSVRQRIHTMGHPLTLRELYTWRMNEWLLADQVAWTLGNKGRHLPNFIVSVKQPAHMLFRLLFEESVPRVYASFPMTATRGKEKVKREIDAFRHRLHRDFVVFDPLSIDERVMETWRETMEKSGTDRITFQFDGGPPSRWDCRVAQNGEEKNYGPLLWDDDLGETTIHLSEILELRERVRVEGESDIDDQITSRDFRFIDQADYVVCYRPHYGDRWSGGVNAEVNYANDTLRPVYAFLSTDGPPHQPLRGRFDYSFREDALFWESLQDLARRGPDADVRGGRKWL